MAFCNLPELPSCCGVASRCRLEAAVRGQGLASLGEAGAVVLETDGSLHVLPRIDADPSALRNVQGSRL